MNMLYIACMCLTFIVCTNVFTQKREASIDVVIPACVKDLGTLNYAIDGIRKNGIGVRRIIVVSEKKLTDKAEWVSESLYPFTKKDIESVISAEVLGGKKYEGQRIGWIFQQLLKLYAFYVIPDVTDDLLILDADTVFLYPVSFIDEDGNALYNVGTEFHASYFKHAQSLISKNPIKKVFAQYSGICHHMLFRKNVIECLFDEIEGFYGKPLWQVMLINIDRKVLDLACMSEYEIYFNYIFGRHYQAKIRKLYWENCSWNENVLQAAKERGLDYISCHAYL